MQEWGDMPKNIHGSVARTVPAWPLNNVSPEVLLSKLRQVLLARTEQSW